MQTDGYLTDELTKKQKRALIQSFSALQRRLGLQKLGREVYLQFSDNHKFSTPEIMGGAQTFNFARNSPLNLRFSAPNPKAENFQTG